MKCAVESCDKPKERRDWCAAHYFHWRTKGDPLARAKMGRPPLPDVQCNVDDCDSLADKGHQGMCTKHYRRWLRTGDPSVSRQGLRFGAEATQKCGIKGCSRKPKARGWCAAHYGRWHRSGDPAGIRKLMPVKPRKIRRRQSDVDAVLALRGQGVAFSEIGKQLGMTKNAAFALWRRNKQ